MADQEPQNRQEMDQSELAAREKSREKHYQRFGFDASANNITYLMNDEGTKPDLGKDLTTFYFLCQISPHGGTEISGWELGNVFQAMSNRTLENQWLRMSTNKISKETNGELGQLNNRSDLVSAMTKQGIYKYLNFNDLSLPEGRDGYNSDLSDEEMVALGRLERNLEGVKNRCLTCGDVGKTLYSWVELKTKQTFIDSAMRDPNLSADDLESLQDQLDATGPEAEKLNKKIRVADLMMKDGSKQTETQEWVNLLTAAVGVNEIFSLCKQWLTNQSDLGPIAKVWEYQGRMTELHPSALEAMAKEWPSFNDAFQGMLAIGSWKYALGDNGEIYPSGKYGLGYVNRTTGEVVDVDEAVTRGVWGEINGILPGYVGLGENQIFVSGGIVNVDAQGKAIIAGNEVKIFMRNYLVDTGVKLKDSDVIDFLKMMAEFTKGKNNMMADYEIELGVELAREFYEFSLMANWNGIARDKQRRPYYMMYVPDPADPNKFIANPWTLSSNPDSQAVKFGRPIKGSTDEATLFPYWTGGDWGKLTQTRAKQRGELGKGRKHGLYTLIPFLPENLVQPFLKKETDGNGNITKDVIEEVLSGRMKMNEVFADMSAVEHFKTYWLDIFKGVAVYEFISSSFLGDKDPTKADIDLLNMFMQPRLMEGLNKDIDLSLFWVDKMEAARLKVNIVLAGLAAVAKEFSQTELFGVSPKGIFDGRLGGYVSDVNEKDLVNTSDIDKWKLALRQLVASRFIGDEKEVMRVISKLKQYRDGNQTGSLGFSMAEFKSVFGVDYLTRYQNSRDQRKAVVDSRVV